MPSDSYLSRDALFAALTNTHEKDVYSSLFGGRVLIREITARQRMLAQQAAQAEDGENPDNALYQAMLVQMSVVNPESGQTDATGRIDPRTRTPMFAVADVLSLVNARFGPINQLVEAIQELAGLGPAAMFSGDTEADRPERGTGTSAAGAEATTGEAPDQGSGDTGERGAFPDGDSPADGAEPRSSAG